MSPEVSDLLRRALSLPVDERAALANTLLESLESTYDSGAGSVEEAWDREVERRIEDLKTGKAMTVPWEQLHRELRAMINER